VNIWCNGTKAFETVDNAAVEGRINTKIGTRKTENVRHEKAGKR
jgi:hypothetical protein